MVEGLPKAALEHVSGPNADERLHQAYGLIFRTEVRIQTRAER